VLVLVALGSFLAGLLYGRVVLPFLVDRNLAPVAVMLPTAATIVLLVLT